MFSSIYKYFFILLLFIILCFMGIVFSLDSIGSFNDSNTVTNNLITDFSSPNLVWPTPRL